MINESLAENSEQQAERIALMRTPHFKETRFKFLNEHYGLRRGKLHLLIGTQGKGKSTLARSIMLDMSKDHRVLLYSTEESIEDTKDMMALRKTKPEDVEKLRMIHERSIQEKTSVKDLDEWARLVEITIVNNETQILFFDNITTSAFYTGNEYALQIKLTNKLKELCVRYEIPVFIVAHTNPKVRDDQSAFIDGGDIAGPRFLANNAEFLYTYQKIINPSKGTADATYGIVKVAKARGDGNIGGIYLLDYDFERREYFGDAKISYETMKKIWDARAKLGGR